MEMTLLKRLQGYIDDELSAHEYYRDVAKIAPNEEYRKLLIETSDDEERHANEFKKIYRMLTGRDYNPDLPKAALKGDFRNNLRESFLDEIEAYKDYGKQYVETDRNRFLKELYYTAQLDENVHALRMLYMMGY